MTQGLELPLTVVSAPAGYGKSTLVSQWAESLEQPSAWLSLDPGDSDLKLFLRYFLAALDAVFTDVCPETRVLCASSHPVPFEVLGGSLANELDAIDSPLVLVLDDYHRIAPASRVHDLLRFLLDHPPRALRLVLVSRIDPPLLIALLRARGQVVEIRLRELKFAPSECAQYLERTCDVRVSEESLSNLVLQTEGWIVALRLVALHLQQIDDPEAALRALRGGVQETSEYLLYEVIDRLPPLTLEWLLKTAILDRFCPRLCDALAASEADSEEPAYNGAQFVRALTTDNLFTIPLDIQGHWFRYHHLFQEVLLEQLDARVTPQEIAALHLRASQWFEREGYIDEALKHALAVQDIKLVVQLVARHRHSMLDADHWYVLANWLSLIPESVIQQHAELLMTRAWVLMHNYQFEALFSVLDRVASLITQSPAGESLRGEVSLCRGYGLFFVGEGEDSLKHITEALEQVPLTHYEARAQCEVIFALSSQMTGAKQQGISYLDELITRYDSPEELRKTRLLVTYVFIRFIDADLAEAELANARLRELAELGAYAYAQAWSDHMQGLIHLQRGEWDSALEYLERSVAQRFIHFKRAATDSIVGLALVHQMEGREADSRSTLMILQDYATSLDDPTLWPLVGSAQLRLATLLGRTAHTARDGLALIALPAEPAMLWWLDVPSVTGCRALIVEGAPDNLAAAEAVLVAHVETSEAQHNSFQLIRGQSLLALLLEKQGRTDEALDMLERALAMAQPGGLVFPFLEPGKPMAELLGKLRGDKVLAPFIKQLLAAGSRSPEPVCSGATRSAQSAIDLLTDREQQIIELLAQRLQYKEIAVRLSISPQTVNSHLKNAYQKLGVNNRRQAVARALELGQISST